MIAKNGIDWNTMGFTVYGECPEYKSTLHKTSKNHRNKDKNISYLPAYKAWTTLLRIDRGTEYGRSGVLCEEWKDFDNFSKWYEKNHYEVDGERTFLTYKLFNPDNDYISPETTCYIPSSINYNYYKPRYNTWLANKVEQFKKHMPEKVYNRLKEIAEGCNGQME